MKKIIYLLGFLILGLIISCQKEEENTMINDSSSSVQIVGKWEVTAHNDSVPLYGPFTLLTLKSNSAGNDSIIIQDSEQKFWKFQVKASVNETEGTFQTKLSSCDICEEETGIKIANGKFVDTDSIYFEIQFEDDITPYGQTYRLKGHRVNE